MKTKTYNGDLSICNRTDLMCDSDFMDKERITEKCKCSKEATCKMVCDLLLNKKYDDALNILKNNG